MLNQRCCETNLYRQFGTRKVQLARFNWSKAAIVPAGGRAGKRRTSESNRNIARWPLPLRLLLLFLVGVSLGSLVNLGIYRLAYFRRRISPWSRTRGEVASRRWFDRLPVMGWLSLRREASIHGRGFWIRPMLVELFYGLGIVALYWWEVEQLALIPLEVRPLQGFLMPDAITLLHGQFLVQVVLLILLGAATFIDIDEQTIPDAVTVSGTLVALVLAAICHAGVLPGLQWDPQNARFADLILPLRFDYPEQANQLLASAVSLVIGLICYAAWCFALFRGIGGWGSVL